MKTKIFGACLLGGAIGAAVALQISTGLLGLAIGMLLGGAIGYIAVAPLGFIRDVGHCLAVAWRAVTGQLTMSQRARVMLWLLNGSMMIGVVCYYVTFVFTLGFAATMFGAHPDNGWQVLYFAVAIIGGFFASMGGLYYLTKESETPISRFDVVESSLKMVIKDDSLTESQKVECCQTVRRDCMQLLLCSNGFTGMLYGVFATVVGILLPPALVLTVVGLVGFLVWRFWEDILELIRLLPGAGLRFVRAFISTFFRVVHSEARVTCGVAAMVGVVIGWVGASPLLGGLVGGLVGVAFYALSGVGLRFLAEPGAKT